MRRRVLIDRHHHALFYSLQKLFEDRLGMTVYTPIGHEWWDEGYWRFGEGYGDDRLARQFLNADGWTDYGSTQQPGYRTLQTVDGHHPDRRILGVELGTVLNTPAEWAYVVATVQDNQHGFHRLAQDLTARTAAAYLSNPEPTPVKYVLQVGNTNQAVDWGLDPLAIVSSEVPIKGRGVLVHQEFDSDTVFRYREPDGERVIRSFVNCFGSTPCIRPFDDMRALLPDFTFGNHGIDGPDGNIETVTEIADLMAGSAFGWHDKVQGDGFGHVLHDWAAIGRPLIGHAAHYRGLMGEGFWQDMVTCIDLDKRTLPEAAQLVGEIIADRARHQAMCEAIRAEFDKIDYAAEAESVRALLS